MFTILFLFFFPIALLLTHYFLHLFYTCEVSEFYYLKIFLAVFITLYLIKKIKPFTNKININSSLSNIGILLIVPISILIYFFMFSVYFPALFHSERVNVNGGIKQTIGNMRSQANLYYKQNNFSYENMCTDETFTKLAGHLKTYGSNQSCLGLITKNIKPKKQNFTCNSTTDSYAVEALLMPQFRQSIFDLSEKLYLCADSKNTVIENNTSIGSSTSCVINKI